jgi:hypothetical protein
VSNDDSRSLFEPDDTLFEIAHILIDLVEPNLNTIKKSSDTSAIWKRQTPKNKGCPVRQAGRPLLFGEPDGYHVAFFLCQDRLNHFTGSKRQPRILPLIFHSQPFMINSHQIQKRCVKIMHADRVFYRCVTKIVNSAAGNPTLEPPTATMKEKPLM